MTSEGRPFKKLSHYVYHKRFMSLFPKKRPTSYTINARDPIPAPPGHHVTHEVRPPPKVYHPHRDFNGLSGTKIQRMMVERRQYEEECERVKTETDIALFESKHGGKSFTIPSLPIPPQIDSDVLRSFYPPSLTRLYDVDPPNITPLSEKRARRPVTPVRPMSRGCPSCNPDVFDQTSPKLPPPSRNGQRINREEREPTPRSRDALPIQMNQAYWNVLDEPSLPARPQTAYRKTKKPAQFCMLQTGPRPSGIPICIGDLLDSRSAGQTKFEDQMSKVVDREMYNREMALHKRAMTCRAQTRQMKDRTMDIAADSGQAWATSQSREARTARKEAREAREREQRLLGITSEDAEAMAALSRYDETLYQKYQEKKRPIEDVALFLEQRGMRKRTQ
jgi:hypothetical protein